MRRLFLRGVPPAAFFTILAVASGQELAVPGADVAKDIPGAQLVPNPSTTYKVLFDVSKASPNDGDVNPILNAAARYINTLAKYGVKQDHRKIAVIFHQGGTSYILNNDAYRERTGKDNPNVAIIRALRKAGVEFHVCGQAVLAAKIDPKNIQPEIGVDLWALTTIVELEMQGYVRIGG